MVKTINIENLKRVLIVQLPVAGLACLALIYAISFVQARHHLESEPEEEFQLLTSTLEQRVEDALSDATVQMQNLARVTMLSGMDITPRLAEQVRAQAKGISDVSIYDTFGCLLATTCDQPLEVGPYGDLFESALRGRPAVSRPVTVDRERSRQEVLMLVPVMDEFEQPTMVLAGTFPMDDVWTAIDGEGVGGDMSIAFLDTFGQVVAQPGDVALSGLAALSTEEPVGVAASPGAQTLNDKFYYIARELSQEVDVAGPAWTILYLRPYSAVTSLVSRLSLLNVSMSAVTLGLMAFVGLTMVKRIQHPLENTLAAAEKVAKGELDVTLPDDGPVELKSIASAINHMSAEVRYHRQTMSAMVEARARRLERPQEIDLRHNQQLEAMSHMAGSVAHDFNNLLTVIVGNLSLARLECDVDHDVREYLDSVCQAASDATGLAKQLLGVSNRTRLNQQDMSPNHVLIEVQEVLRFNMDANLRIVTELESDLWDVAADPGQLRHAFTSAAMSSLDAMEGAGELRLGSSNVTLEAGGSCMPGDMGPGDYVRISFKQGQGDELEEELVFESFLNSKKQQSPGLGSSMAFGIVKKHGGWMTSTSEESLGTRVCIYLPKADRRSETMKVETSEKSPGARSEACVLVVDDEPGVRRIAISVLKRRGVSTLEAADGEEALQVYKENRSQIGLVLLDMSMPKLSGKETFQQLKAIDEELPVLVCSGYPVSPVEFEMETGHAPNGVIQKPFQLATLANQVCAVLGVSEVQSVS